MSAGPPISTTPEQQTAQEVIPQSAGNEAASYWLYWTGQTYSCKKHHQPQKNMLSRPMPVCTTTNCSKQYSRKKSGFMWLRLYTVYSRMLQLRVTRCIGPWDRPYTYYSAGNTMLEAERRIVKSRQQTLQNITVGTCCTAGLHKQLGAKGSCVNTASS